VGGRGGGVTSEALQVAAGTLEALALHEGASAELHVRSAWEAGSQTLWVWLGPGRYLAVDAQRWRVLREAPVLFRVYPTLQELPDPVEGDLAALEELLELVGPRDERLRRLLIVWLALAWLPHVARPILLFVGDMGSGKTLRQRIIKRLLDPAKPESIRLDAREIIQKLAHCQIALLDNLGSIPELAIDTLCRAVTGEGDSKRRLYSDEEDVVFEFKRAILLNGINPPADRPDLNDRLLPVPLERIPDEERRKEEAIWEFFARRHATWLGALATLLSAAMCVRASVRLRRLPRLADWGKWTAAIYEAAGWGAAQFESDWSVVVGEQQRAAIEGSPVGQALLRWIEQRTSWRGTATELLGELAPVAEELRLLGAKAWPRTPVWLARRLREIRPVLLATSVVIREERGSAGERLWCIERRPIEPTPEDAPRIPSGPSVLSEPASPAQFSPDSNRVVTVSIDALPSDRDPQQGERSDGIRHDTDGIDPLLSSLLSGQNPCRDEQPDGTNGTDSKSGSFGGNVEVNIERYLAQRMRRAARLYEIESALPFPPQQVRVAISELIRSGVVRLRDTTGDELHGWVEVVLAKREAES
jgi:hypothetical protein